MSSTSHVSPPPPPKPKPAPKPAAKPAHAAKPAPKQPTARENHVVAERLIKGLNNPEKGVVHHCYAYAWATVAAAGGKGVGSAPADASERGQPTSALAQLEKNGKLHVGDVVYVNYHPGTDPRSVNLANGPHWFVYMGSGKYADQYGVKQSAAEMDQFVPGRKIDTIYHCFNGHPADPPPGALDNLGDSSAVSGGGSSSSMGLSGGASGASGGGSAGGGGTSAPAASAAAGPMPEGKAEPATSFNLLLQKLEAMGLDEDWLKALAKKHHVPLKMLLGVIMQESRGNPNARSGAGAEGLMQLMPDTAKGLGVGNALDPKENVEGGVKYLGQLMQQFDGDHKKVLAAYNSGAGNVEKYGGVPPFAETQHYVANITASLDNAQAALARAASSPAFTLAIGPCAGRSPI